MRKTTKSVIRWVIPGVVLLVVAVSLARLARNVHFSRSGLDKTQAVAQPSTADQFILDAIHHSPHAQAYIKRCGGDYSYFAESEDSESTVVEIGQDHDDHFEMGFELKASRNGNVWVRDVTLEDQGERWHIDYKLP